MTKRNDSKSARTTTQACFLDRDDVDNAILEYIHANWPETEGLDITKWDFRRGEVEVTFDLDTYKNLGHVSAREHNEALIEIETLLDENEQLLSDIEELEHDRVELSHELDDTREQLENLESDIDELENDYLAQIDSLEDELERLKDIIADHEFRQRGERASRPSRRRVAPVGHSDDEDCAHCDHA